MELARPFVELAGLSNVELVSEGMEFFVFRAHSQEDGNVALKIPKAKVFQNINDPRIEARDLIEQELRIYELLQGGPVPVPKPFRFLEADGYPAMLCEYVEDDGSSASPQELGRIAALIHKTPLPQGWDSRLVAHEHGDVLATIPQRMMRRFGELVKHEPTAAEWIPKEGTLQPIAEQLKRLPSCLLHLDFRDVNLRVRSTQVVAVFDWTNALIGPAVLDIFRILELVQPGEGFVEAYKQTAPFPKLSAKEETLLRLDAALMLALVFISEMPNPERRGESVRRVGELAKALQA